MRGDVSLCPHLAGEPPALAIASDDVLDWLDGPITAVASCPRCGGLALLEMLDWSASRAVRVYAVAALAPEPFALYRRNARRATCDVGRLAEETEALFACAGRVERLLALAVADGAVLASAPVAGLPLPVKPWPERLPPAGDGSWFARLGLDKAAL